MILKQKKINNFILRLIKFQNFIAVDFFNFEIGVFLKTFNNTEQEKAEKFFNTLNEQNITKYLNN